jgi:hypothetical protein
LFAQSCNNEDNEKSSYLSPEEANFIAVNHLYLNGEKYYLDLNKDQALKLGISLDDFYRMKQEVADVNRTTEKWDKERIIYHLEDPQALVKNLESSNLLTRLKSGSESESGNGREKVLNASGQDWVYGSFFVPSGTSSVSITCFGGGLLTTYNVSAKTCGNTSTSGGVGLLGIWSATLSLHCSNTDCTIGFKTSNSNGGGCTYSW